jgi:Xaa-Pro aminopeptidase
VPTARYKEQTNRVRDDVMEPAYLYTAEPALFVSDVAGYRHSDTILVTEGGNESLTYYPKYLESNAIRY